MTPEPSRSGPPAARRKGPEPENRGPKPVSAAPKLPGHLVLNDLRIRLAGIPFFGIVIPNLTGLFGPIGPRSALYWIGYVWFVLLSGLIWQGNRYFMIQQRRYYDWFDHPWRKVTLLLFANVFYTAPLTLLMLAAWYRFAGFAAIDWGVVRLVTLMVVICVVFITHVYETVYLIQQRESDLVAVARLDRARAEAELLALKSQVSPHFLFNSLNALAHLIPHDPERALRFTEGLADTYRYILTNGERDLVPLADELAFAEGYVGLLQLRFGDAIRMAVEGPPRIDSLLVPPISVQVALENAVKHNVFDREAPLDVRLRISTDRVSVTNPLRPKAAPGSPRLGLANLDERCRRVTGQGIEVRLHGAEFEVVVPVLRTSA